MGACGQRALFFSVHQRRFVASPLMARGLHVAPGLRDALPATSSEPQRLSRVACVTSPVLTSVSLTLERR